MRKIVLLLMLLANFNWASSALGFEPDSQVEDLDIHPTDVIIWELVQAQRLSDGSIELGLRLSTRDNFGIYKDKLSFQGPTGFEARVLEAPESQARPDPLSDGLADLYEFGDFLVVFESFDQFQGTSFPFTIKFLGCTERICLFPYEQAFTAEISSPITLPKPKSVEATSKTPAKSFDERLLDQVNAKTTSLTTILLLAILGGLLTNLTPCVFPMIPITMRILGNPQQKNPKLNSIAYATGIIVSYTLLGSLAALSGSLFGAFLGNLYVSLAIAIVFIFLGLSMLGYGDFSKLQNLGNRLGAGKQNMASVVAMGAGAGLVAAPCTGPILGALLLFSPKLGSFALSVLMFFSYSVGFALPYLFLGLAAQKIGKWSVPAVFQIGVKALFAGVMFALAAFYLKTPLNSFLQKFAGNWQIVTYVASGLGLVMIASVLASKKLQTKKAIFILPCFVLGVGLFSMSQWLTGADMPTKIQWVKNEKEAYELATMQNKPILVDGWAEWCVACKQMDSTTFQDASVVLEIEENWIALKLDLTEFNEANEALAAKYGMPGLPTLVFIPSNGELDKSIKLTGYVGSDKLKEEMRSFLGN